jgi:hypothetical protein
VSSDNPDVAEQDAEQQPDDEDDDVLSHSDSLYEDEHGQLFRAALREQVKHPVQVDVGQVEILGLGPREAELAKALDPPAVDLFDFSEQGEHGPYALLA